MGRYKPSLWGPRVLPLEALAISSIPDFQIAFPCTIRWPNYFRFYVFSCLLKTCKVTSSPHHYTLNGSRKWQVTWAYNNFFSKPHVHAFSCRPKRCWSQINYVLILSHNALSLQWNLWGIKHRSNWKCCWQEKSTSLFVACDIILCFFGYKTWLQN